MSQPESAQIILGFAPHVSELAPKPPFQDEVFGGLHPLYNPSTQRAAVGSCLLVDGEPQLGFVAYEYPWDLDHTLPLRSMVQRGLVTAARTVGAERLLPESDGETGLAMFELAFGRQQEDEVRLLLASRALGYIAEGRAYRGRSTHALAVSDSFDQKAYQTVGFELTGRSGKYAGYRLLELHRNPRSKPLDDDVEKTK